MGVGGWGSVEHRSRCVHLSTHLGKGALAAVVLGVVQVAPIQHQVEREDHHAEDRAAKDGELPAQLHRRASRGGRKSRLRKRSLQRSRPAPLPTAAPAPTKLLGALASSPGPAAWPRLGWKGEGSPPGAGQPRAGPGQRNSPLAPRSPRAPASASRLSRGRRPKPRYSETHSRRLAEEPTRVSGN